MSALVNTETGEITEAMTLDEARRLTERIRVAASNYTEAKEKILTLVDQAKAGLAHVALGYKSWTAYLSDTLSDEPLRLAREERRELVTRLADEGMSTRAIAPIVGAHHTTVAADLSTVGNPTVAPGLARATTGLDGRERITATAGQVKSDSRAMAEANAINAFTAILRRTFKPENVANLSPAAKRRLTDLLNEAIQTLNEGDGHAD